MDSEICLIRNFQKAPLARGFFLAAALREHRIEHLRDSALLGLGQGFDLVKLLPNLLLRPALPGRCLGRRRRVVGDQRIERGVERLGDHWEQGHRHAASPLLERVHRLLRHAELLGQLHLGDSAKNEGSWKEKFPTEKGWRRYSLTGALLTPQMAHPGPSRAPSFLQLVGATFRWGLIFVLSSYSAPLGESEQQAIDIRNENEEPY